MKQRGLSSTTFGRWKSRLENLQKKPMSLTATKTAIAGNKTAGLPITTSGKKQAGQKNAVKDRVELKHVSGFTLVFDAQTNEVLLKKVLKNLSELTSR